MTNRQNENCWYLVIEVAVSSLAYDKGLKARLYARHRVREFWVIDANAGITWIHSHRPERRRMVVGRKMRAARHAHHSGAAWLLHQTRRDRLRNIAARDTGTAGR